jgi:hypothetical protein
MVDPSFFSQALMYYYHYHAIRDMDFPPHKHMAMAYKNLLADEEVLAGGATACAVSLSPDGLLSGVKSVIPQRIRVRADGTLQYG